jgi:hypothetical protein
MTPDEEARFIALWNAGTDTAAIARALGIPPGTARSRAYTLQQSGKIAPRPRGGKRTPARASADGPPARAPATHPRVNIKQWTIRLSQPLIDAVKAQAAAEGKEPSHLVEEVLWTALTDRRSPTP